MASGLSIHGFSSTPLLFGSAEIQILIPLVYCPSSTWAGLYLDVRPIKDIFQILSLPDSFVLDVKAGDLVYFAYLVHRTYVNPYLRA